MQDLKVSSIVKLEGGCFTFTLQEFSVSSDSCVTRQEAYDHVFKAMRDWALTVTPDISALSGPVAAVVPGICIRDVGTGAGSFVLRRLLDKFGEISNRQLAEAIGFREDASINPSIFSSSLAGKGKRYVRCVIAAALGELPSTLWPFLSVKILQNDDSVYLSCIDAPNVRPSEAL